MLEFHRTWAQVVPAGVGLRGRVVQAFGVAMCAALCAAGCGGTESGSGSNDDAQGDGTTTGAQTGQDTTGDGALGGGAGASGSTASDAADTTDGQTAGMGATDGQSGANDAMDDGSDTADASDASDAMDGDDASDATDDDASGTDAQTPLTLPSPDEVGPYEAIEEENVGEGFENAIASGDRGDGLGCLGFIMSFGQDEESARDYAMIPEDHDMALYTLYRPSEIPEGMKLPALSWANGTCAHPVGYASMIKHLVSHGFIVVAAHSRYTGSGEAQVNGLNYLVAENENPDSPLFGHVDTDALGVFGHSQGSSSTANASDDPRVASVIFMHGGTANPDAPALYLTSDLEARGVMRGYDSASGQAAYGKLNDSDHITMMVEHERMAPEVTAWFRYTLLADDQEAASWFVGSDCLLCNDSEWVFMAKGLE